MNVAARCLTQKLLGLLVGANPKLTLVRTLLWPSAILALTHYFLIPVRITGPSMFPTYHDGSINVINRTAYFHHEPKRGDVIALREGDEILFKRIVGMPNETVCIHSGKIVIDGRPLFENIRVTHLDEDIDPVNLRKDQYFFIGDNRKVSEFGTVTKERILGKAIF
jgi:signal peptidase I